MPSYVLNTHRNAHIHSHAVQRRDQIHQTITGDNRKALIYAKQQLHGNHAHVEKTTHGARKQSSHLGQRYVRLPQGQLLCVPKWVEDVVQFGHRPAYLTVCQTPCRS